MQREHFHVHTENYIWPCTRCDQLPPCVNTLKKKRAKSLLVPFRGMIFISCAVQLADWGLLQEMRGNVEVVVLD